MNFASFILAQCLGALSQAAILFFIACGLTLIFGIMRIVNFAQGELLMLGMYASLYLVTGAGVLAFLGPYFGPFRRPSPTRFRTSATKSSSR